MTDREMLELAGKAIGLECGGYDAERGLLLYYEHPLQPSAWNPLTYYGDTLTLACKFRMGIHYETQFIDGKDVEIVEVYYSHDEENHSCKVVAETLGDKAEVALMRAVTRAAAEIQLQKERDET